MLKRKGFTLLELIITILIIGILSSSLFLSQPVFKRQTSVQRAAYQLSKDIREVQEKALATNLQTCPSGIFKGFGIYFDINYPTRYQLFYKCDTTRNIIKTINLEEGVFIQSLSPSSPLEILFEPPDPIVYINNNSWSNQEAQIILNSSYNLPSIKIKINNTGRISIEQNL
jgi:prepilin-type N-terminal cleavage/methylation domain-containing protein